MDINKLFIKSRGGDSEAEKKLFEELTVRFRLFVSRKVPEVADAEEIIQDAILVVVNNLKTIEIETSFGAWAYAVVKFKIRDYLKSKKRRRKYVSHEPVLVDEMTGPESTCKLETNLLDCLREICVTNRRYARVLNLKYQGYSAKSIYQKLGITRENLYVIVSRARSLLKSCLERKGSI